MTDPGFLLSRAAAAVRAGFKDVLAGWGIRPQQYVVTITQAGLSALAELRQAVSEYNERVLSPLTGREQRQLAATLSKLFATTAEGRGR